MHSRNFSIFPAFRVEIPFTAGFGLVAHHLLTHGLGIGDASGFWDLASLIFGSALMGTAALARRGLARPVAVSPAPEPDPLPPGKAHALLAALDSLILEVDGNGLIRRCHATGFRHPALAGDSLSGTRFMTLTDAGAGLTALGLIRQSLRHRQVQRTEMFLGRLSQWFDCSFSPLNDTTVLIIARDITGVKSYEEQLRRQAYRDPLTGLPNKELLISRLKHALARLREEQRHQYFVLFIDLDRFRVVNESYGVPVGDALLREVAARVGRHLRDVDTLSRFGRDEFVVLLDDISGKRVALRVAEDILASFQHPVVVGDREIYITASIGILMVQPGHRDPGDVLRDAEAAMYEAKAQGNRARMFQPAMYTQTLENLALENDLRGAVRRGEFEVYYQPIVDLATERITGMEALLRWRHPERGMVPPSRFIPLAEDTGMILGIGEWVLETACAFAAGISRNPSPDSPPCLSVNISARQIMALDFVDTLTRILERTGLPGNRLKLEITEYVMVRHGEEVNTAVSRLKDLGIRLSMDDFGTGYSSLASLHHLPFDDLKIDKSFVQRVSEREDKHVDIVRAIVSLARCLDMTTIAEGIETPEQLRRLRDMGCALGQGYLLGHPLTADTFAALLTDRTHGNQG